MKRFLPVLIALIAFVGAGWYQRIHPPANPDPNHAHADFAVWVGGVQLDFSAAEYMSGLSTDETTHDEAGEVHHLSLHLHDGNGHVIHRHKPGLSLADFFASIGLPTSSGTCLKLDTYQHALVAEFLQEWSKGDTLCPDGKFHWQMFVNGIDRPIDFNYVFADEDQILLVYSAADIHTKELESMTYDACLYSKTCPWRGEPPAENCIADPTVPCVLEE